MTNEEIVEKFLSRAFVDYEEYEEYTIGDVSYNAIKDILEDYKKVKEELDRKDNTIRYICKRLENDNIRIKESLREEWSDDYRKCRLKAYATKTREIGKLIKNNYFGENDKGE